jgi:hypothetical protein
MTTLTVTPHLSARLAQRPLSGIFPRYQSLLSEQGYTARSSESHLYLLANLNEWLERHDLRAPDPSGLCRAETPKGAWKQQPRWLTRHSVSGYENEVGCRVQLNVRVS